MMSYSDIIRNNCEKHSPVSWWPKFAYHCTDVTNAVSILASGILYSRASAKHLGLMANDNASRQVIDMTQTEATSCARFYFRPLTPTQYYNEGFKHTQLRYDNDENANMPVPVFLLFDLAKLLSIPKVKFSEQKQSGRGSTLQSGEEAFSQLNFDYIYSIGFNNINETKPYRHAEILHPNSLQIDSCINYILCRNNVERTTLLNMLKNRNQLAFRKYKDIIKICKSDMFEHNGLYVTDCQYHDNVISVSFSDSRDKASYTRSLKQKNNVSDLKPVTVRLELDWLNSRGVVYHNATQTQIDYERTVNISFKGLRNFPNAKIIRIQVLIEDKLMCFVEFSLETSELIK